MCLHEHPCDTRRDRGAGEHWNELALAARSAAQSTRKLHGMCRIEYHRTAGGAHDRQGTHIGHQVVISERCTALAHEYVVAAARLACLGNHIEHILRSEELALFDVHGFS